MPVYSSWRSAARKTRRFARWVAVRSRLARTTASVRCRTATKLFVPFGAAYEDDHRLHRETGRNFTRGVPAHPVCDDQQLQSWIAEEAVFIGLADRPDVAQAVGFDHLRSSSMGQV